MEIIHIALPSDQNYLPGLIVTAGSIAHHTSKDVSLMIHVLDGGIKDDSFDDFTCKIRRLHPHVDFNRIHVDEKLFKNYPAFNGNKMTYARLLLSEALPDVSHVIYSDTDFLWLIDISELWRERSDDKIFIGVKDIPQTIAREEKWAEEHNLEFDSEHYVCGGLSFYNLDKFREDDIPGKVAQFIARYPDVKFADQTAINHLLQGRLTLVDGKWQTLSTALTPEHLKNPVAIHYGGDTPWRRSHFWTVPVSDGCLLWFAMLDYIEGVRPGTSLKLRLSRWQRFYKRSLANIYRYRIPRTLFNIILKASGRGSYIPKFNVFARPLGLSKKGIITVATQSHKS